MLILRAIASSVVGLIIVVGIVTVVAVVGIPDREIRYVGAIHTMTILRRMMMMMMTIIIRSSLICMSFMNIIMRMVIVFTLL